jgi:hypothetical protein
VTITESVKRGAPQRASLVFKVRSVWVPPLVLVAVLVLVMTLGILALSSTEDVLST